MGEGGAKWDSKGVDRPEENVPNKRTNENLDKKRTAPEKKKQKWPRVLRRGGPRREKALHGQATTTVKNGRVPKLESTGKKRLSRPGQEPTLGWGGGEKRGAPGNGQKALEEGGGEERGRKSREKPPWGKAKVPGGRRDEKGGTQLAGKKKERQ